MKRFLPFVLAALLLISSGRLLLKGLTSFNASNVSHDAVSSWDVHMRSVAAALPPGVHVVGYLEDKNLDATLPGPDLAEFFLTQYGLAPVVVQAGADHDWIVGNFGGALAQTKIRSALDRTLGSYTMQDFGFGVHLIHRFGR